MPFKSARAARGNYRGPTMCAPLELSLSSVSYFYRAVIVKGGLIVGSESQRSFAPGRIEFFVPVGMFYRQIALKFFVQWNFLCTILVFWF